MNYTQISADLQEKIAGVDRTITLAAGTSDRLINIGWRMLWSKLMVNDKVADFLWRSAKLSLTVNSSGFLELPARASRVLLIEQNKVPIARRNLDVLTTLGERGWCYAGQKADNDTTKQIEIYENGSVVGSGAIYDVWVAYAPLAIASAYSAGISISTPTVPEQYHELIATGGAFEYFNRKGLRYQTEAAKFLQQFNSGIDEAIREISWTDDAPEFLIRA